MWDGKCWGGGGVDQYLPWSFSPKSVRKCVKLSFSGHSANISLITFASGSRPVHKHTHTPRHGKPRFCLYFPPFNPLIRTLKPQSNGPLYSNTVIGTLAVDGWTVTFGTTKRGPRRTAAPPRPPPRCTKCNSPPINGQCTNFVLFDVAL